MKHIKNLAAWTVSLLLALVSAQAGQLKFGGPINGAQSGTSSAAMGSAILTLDTSDNTFDLAINISNLRNDLTASHIHVGAEGESGGVILGLGDESEYTVIGDFYAYQAMGIPFEAGNLVDLIAGGTYLNFHTAQFPGGEVRGQLAPIEENADTLVNISTRGLVDPANGGESQLIAGFSILDDKTVVLRAVGESLVDNGIANPLEDAQFDLYKLNFDGSDNEMLGSANDWQDEGQKFKIAATGLAPSSDSDAAWIGTLGAGVYTLNATAASGEGIALVEAFGVEASGVGSAIDAAANGASPAFTIINAALEATGLDAILDGPGPFTLFAPTDAAFLAQFSEADLAELLADDADQAEDLEALTGILMYHVLGANIPSTALEAGPNTVPALTGVNFTVNVGDGVTAQNGNVVETDIVANNGVIHVVDAVLAPSGIGTELGNSSLSILNAAVAAAGLDSVLDGDGPFTLFAPSDEAFLAIFTEEELAELLADDADQEADLAALAEILSYHVIDSQILSSDLMEGTAAVPALTGLGLNVTLDEGMVSVQDAMVSQADILTGNGVIHIVDGVLAPYGIGSTLGAGGTMDSFTILSAALAATGLDATLDGEGSFTLFAPTDEAFLDIFTNEELEELLADDADQEDDLAALTNILLYHAIGAQVLSTDLAEGVNTAASLNDTNLYVTLDEDGVTVQGAEVTEANILASNGVIHVVDAVLVPSGVGGTIASGGTTESFTILNAALEATGLDAALDGDGPFTLFAPNDDAFLAIFSEEDLAELLADDADQADDLAALADILLYHVIVGAEVRSTDLEEGNNTAESGNGTNLYVNLDGGNVTLQGATVIEADLLAGNGVIHSVDAVLTPSGVGSTIAIDGLDESFSILKAALAATGLDTVLDGDGPFTLFAPNDDAFLAAFTEEELAELLADDADQASDLAALEGILVYHVVGDLVLSTDLDPGVNMVQSISLADIDVTVIGDDVTVESANAIGFDILAANGVIHVVDAVLVP